MESWSDAFKTQCSNTPVLQRPISLHSLQMAVLAVIALRAGMERDV
jgi:hypothetical protein